MSCYKSAEGPLAHRLETSERNFYPPTQDNFQRPAATSRASKLPLVIKLMDNRISSVFTPMLNTAVVNSDNFYLTTSIICGPDEPRT
jgi:hypothetical protein